MRTPVAIWPPTCQRAGCATNSRWILPCLECGQPVYVCTAHVAELLAPHTRTRADLHRLCAEEVGS